MARTTNNSETPVTTPAVVEEVKAKEPQIHVYLCRYACTKTFRRRIFVPASMATSRFDIPAVRLAFDNGYLTVTEDTADQFMSNDGSRRLTLDELVKIIEMHDDFRPKVNVGKGDFVKVSGPGLKLTEEAKKYIAELTASYDRRKTQMQVGPRSLDSARR